MSMESNNTAIPGEAQALGKVGDDSVEDGMDSFHFMNFFDMDKSFEDEYLKGDEEDLLKDIDDALAYRDTKPLAQSSLTSADAASPSNTFFSIQMQKLKEEQEKQMENDKKSLEMLRKDLESISKKAGDIKQEKKKEIELRIKGLETLINGIQMKNIKEIVFQARSLGILPGTHGNNNNSSSSSANSSINSSSGGSNGMTVEKLKELKEKCPEIARIYRLSRQAVAWLSEFEESYPSQLKSTRQNQKLGTGQGNTNNLNEQAKDGTASNSAIVSGSTRTGRRGRGASNAPTSNSNNNNSTHHHNKKSLEELERLLLKGYKINIKKVPEMSLLSDLIDRCYEWKYRVDNVLNQNQQQQHHNIISSFKKLNNLNDEGKSLGVNLPEIKKLEKVLRQTEIANEVETLFAKIYQFDSHDGTREDDDNDDNEFTASLMEGFKKEKNQSSSSGYVDLDEEIAEEEEEGVKERWRAISWNELISLRQRARIHKIDENDEIILKLNRTIDYFKKYRNIVEKWQESIAEIINPKDDLPQLSFILSDECINFSDEREMLKEAFRAIRFCETTGYRLAMEGSRISAKELRELRKEVVKLNLRDKYRISSKIIGAKEIIREIIGLSKKSKPATDDFEVEGDDELALFEIDFQEDGDNEVENLDMKYEKSALKVFRHTLTHTFLEIAYDNQWYLAKVAYYDAKRGVHYVVYEGDGMQTESVVFFPKGEARSPDMSNRIEWQFSSKTFADKFLDEATNTYISALQCIKQQHTIINKDMRSLVNHYITLQPLSSNNPIGNQISAMVEYYIEADDQYSILYEDGRTNALTFLSDYTAYSQTLSDNGQILSKNQYQWQRAGKSGRFTSEYNAFISTKRIGEQENKKKSSTKAQTKSKKQNLLDDGDWNESTEESSSSSDDDDDKESKDHDDANETTNSSNKQQNKESHSKSGKTTNLEVKKSNANNAITDPAKKKPSLLISSKIQPNGSSSSSSSAAPGLNKQINRARAMDNSKKVINVAETRTKTKIEFENLFSRISTSTEAISAAITIKAISNSLEEEIFAVYPFTQDAVKSPYKDYVSKFNSIKFNLERYKVLVDGLFSKKIFPKDLVKRTISEVIMDLSKKTIAGSSSTSSNTVSPTSLANLTLPTTATTTKPSEKEKKSTIESTASSVKSGSIEEKKPKESENASISAPKSVKNDSVIDANAFTVAQLLSKSEPSNAIASTLPTTIPYIIMEDDDIEEESDGENKKRKGDSHDRKKHKKHRSEKHGSGERDNSKSEDNDNNGGSEPGSEEWKGKVHIPHHRKSSFYCKITPLYRGDIFGREISTGKAISYQSIFNSLMPSTISCAKKGRISEVDKFFRAIPQSSRQIALATLELVEPSGESIEEAKISFTKCFNDFGSQGRYAVFDDESNGLSVYIFPSLDQLSSGSSGPSHLVKHSPTKSDYLVAIIIKHSALKVQKTLKYMSFVPTPASEMDDPIPTDPYPPYSNPSEQDRSRYQDSNYYSGSQYHPPSAQGYHQPPPMYNQPSNQAPPPYNYPSSMGSSYDHYGSSTSAPSTAPSWQQTQSSWNTQPPPSTATNSASSSSWSSYYSGNNNNGSNPYNSYYAKPASYQDPYSSQGHSNSSSNSNSVGSNYNYYQNDPMYQGPGGNNRYPQYPPPPASSNQSQSAGNSSSTPYNPNAPPYSYSWNR